MPRLLLFIVLLLTPLAALAAAGALWSFSQEVESERQRLADARTTLTVEDLQDLIEARLTIGLSLDTDGDLQSVIERQRGRDPRIVSIEVFDREGVTLYHTDRSLVGERIPDPWRMTYQQAEGDDWTLSEGDSTVIGRSLSNAYLQPVGGIALQYLRAEGAGRAGLLEARPLAVVVAASLALAVLLFLAFSLIHRRLSGDLGGARRALAAGQGEGLAHALPAAGGALTLAAGQLTARALEDLERIDNATQVIQAIDDEN